MFFSFHYKEDVWRASIVRNAGRFDAQAAAGWTDASLWEETRRKGDTAIRHLIDNGLEGTSVTAVLIGSQTAQRNWVTYEIEKSKERGNGIFGIYIHKIKDSNGNTCVRGDVPTALADYPVYKWDESSLGRWVELAAINANKECLQHNKKRCWQCKLRLRCC